MLGDFHPRYVEYDFPPAFDFFGGSLHRRTEFAHLSDKRIESTAARRGNYLRESESSHRTTIAIPKPPSCIRRLQLS